MPSTSYNVAEITGNKIGGNNGVQDKTLTSGAQVLNKILNLVILHHCCLAESRRRRLSCLSSFLNSLCKIRFLPDQASFAPSLISRMLLRQIRQYVSKAYL